ATLSVPTWARRPPHVPGTRLVHHASPGFCDSIQLDVPNRVVPKLADHWASAIHAHVGASPFIAASTNAQAIVVATDRGRPAEPATPDLPQRKTQVVVEPVETVGNRALPTLEAERGCPSA